MEWNPMTLRRFRMARATVVAAVIMTGIVAVIGYVLLRVQKPRFGKDKFELIQEGMTEAEVVEALGCPAGDYRPEIWRHPTWFVSPSNLIGVPIAERGRPRLEELEELQKKAVEKWRKDNRPIEAWPPQIEDWPHIDHRIWLAREYGIDVDFDDRGRVIHCALSSLIPPRHPHDPIRWFRWWIGW